MKSILQEKLLSIKDTITIFSNSLIKDEDSILKDKYTNYLNSNMEGTKNAAVAFYQNIATGVGGKYLFSLSSLNKDIELVKRKNYQGQIIHTKLINEIEKAHDVTTVLYRGIYYRVKRLDEDLNFQKVTTSSIDMQHFMQIKEYCCERKIIEHIKTEYVHYREKILNEDFYVAEAATLTGEIYIYTRLEPCLYCYSLLQEIKDENPKLKIKLYYEAHRDVQDSDLIYDIAFRLQRNIKSQIIQHYLLKGKKAGVDKQWFEKMVCLFDGSLINEMPAELDEPLKVVENDEKVEEVIKRLNNLPESQFELIKWLNSI